MEETTSVLEHSFAWGEYFYALGILVLLLGALCLCVWLMKRYGFFSIPASLSVLPKGSLRLEGQMPLGPRKSLMVVRCRDKRLVLGVTEQQITLLQELEVSQEESIERQETKLKAPDNALVRAFQSAIKNK